VKRNALKGRIIEFASGRSVLGTSTAVVVLSADESTALAVGLALSACDDQLSSGSA